MLTYHMGWQGEGAGVEAQGKRIRPILVLLTAACCSKDWQTALPAAAAVELVHNFSLIHDDIQDGSPERHHRPSVWWVWGPAQAINAGDSLLVLGRRALLGLHGEGLPAPRVLMACRILDEACQELIEGQCLDLSFEEIPDVSPEAYLEMIGKKTGALFEASLHLGALVGTDDEALAECLARCGRRLGLAFQIRDDILGVWGAAAVTGKPVAADIRRRKKCLPVVYALATAQGGIRQELLRLYAQDSLSDADVTRVLDILEASAARDYCQGMAAERIAEALAELRDAAISPTAYGDFQELTTFLLEREF
jgi:geranylgeranyl diphosphate synthase type I